jgi:hypothetical protein
MGHHSASHHAEEMTKDFLPAVGVILQDEILKKRGIIGSCEGMSLLKRIPSKMHLILLSKWL